MDLLISYTKEDVREKEPWYTASGRAHWHVLYGNQYRHF